MSVPDSQQRHPKFDGRLDGSLWLVFLAVLLMFGQSAIPGNVALSTRLFVLGLFGGFIGALTSANDRRITDGREAYRETRFLSPVNLLPIGGMIGVGITWALLPLVYFIFVGPRFAYETTWFTLGQDLTTAFSTPATMGPISMPFGFFWAGILTIISTLLYLIIVMKEGLAYYAAVIPLQSTGSFLAGIRIFGDPTTSMEIFVAPALLILFFVLLILKPTTGLTGGVLRPLLLTAALVVPLTLLDIVTRGTLQNVPLSHQPAVSLTFRAAYFSLFLVPGFGWFLLRNYLRRMNPEIIQPLTFGALGLLKGYLSSIRTEITQPVTFRAIWLVLVTAVTFTFGYFLRVPAIGTNLAVGSLAIAAGTVALLPITGALYATDGASRKFSARLKEIFLRQKRPRHAYWVAYLILVCVVFLWSVHKLQT